MTIAISDLNFKIGEHTSGLTELSNELNLTSAIEQIFGGVFPSNIAYRSTSNIYDLTESCLGQMADEQKSEVDTVIFFSSNFLAEFSELNGRFGEILRAHKLTPSRVLNVSGTGCVAGFNAVEVASSLISSNRSNKCLAIGLECSKKSQRLYDYVALSDACVAFNIGRRELLNGSATQVKAIKILSNAEQMFRTPKLSAINATKTLLKTFLSENKLLHSDISYLYSNNLFKTIKRFKEKSLGFEEPQMLLGDDYLNQGHFLACDPFINLAKKPVEGAELALLLTESAGHAGGIVCTN